jgi:hypothetical protein
MRKSSANLTDGVLLHTDMHVVNAQGDCSQFAMQDLYLQQVFFERLTLHEGTA